MSFESGLQPIRALQRLLSKQIQVYSVFEMLEESLKALMACRQWHAPWRYDQPQ